MRNDHWRDNDRNFYKAVEKYAATVYRFFAGTTLESKDLESTAETLLGYLPLETNENTIFPILRGADDFDDSLPLTGNQMACFWYMYGDNSPDLSSLVKGYLCRI